MIQDDSTTTTITKIEETEEKKIKTHNLNELKNDAHASRQCTYNTINIHTRILVA